MLNWKWQLDVKLRKNHSTGNLTWPKSREKARHQTDSHLRLASVTLSGSLRRISSEPEKAGRGRMLGSLYWIMGKFSLGGGKGRTTRSLGLSRSLGLLPLSPAECNIWPNQTIINHLRGKKHQVPDHHRPTPSQAGWSCQEQTAVHLKLKLREYHIKIVDGISVQIPLKPSMCRLLRKYPRGVAGQQTLLFEFSPHTLRLT